MAELALGAIGVVPVVEFVFKSFKGLYNNLKTFKQYAREAKRVRQELEVQEAIFKNEWQILRTVFLPRADDSDALDVADHTRRRKLGKLQLDQRLRRALGENYDVCEKAIAMIREDLQELTRELQEVTLLANHQEVVLILHRRGQAEGIALTMFLERASRRHSTKAARDPGPSEGHLSKQDMVREH